MSALAADLPLGRGREGLLPEAISKSGYAEVGSPASTLAAT